MTEHIPVSATFAVLACVGVRIFHYKSMAGRFTLIIRNGVMKALHYSTSQINGKRSAPVRSNSEKVENKEAHIVEARSQGASKPAKRMRTGKLLAWCMVRELVRLPLIRL